MSLRVLHHETRWQPGEYESDNPVRCLNCASEYDEDDQARELVLMGYDAKGERLYLCIDCKPGFTCDGCQITTLEPLNQELDGLCAGCVVKLALAELEAGWRAA